MPDFINVGNLDESVECQACGALIWTEEPRNFCDACLRKSIDATSRQEARAVLGLTEDTRSRIFTESDQEVMCKRLSERTRQAARVKSLM